MKDLCKPKYRSLLQLEHLHSYIMVHYVVYIQNILEKFIVDKSYPSITLMVVHSLDVEKDLLDQEMMEMRYWDSTFHNAIGSTKHNWSVLKNIFRYLQGIKHFVLVFQSHGNVNTDIIGYIDQIPTMSDR